MSSLDDAEHFHPKTLAAWTKWLERHHERDEGVWLVVDKKVTGRQAFTYEEAVIEALRVGWIDSTRRSMDDERSKQWFVRRRKKSNWSQPNRDRIAGLEAAGRMLPAGIAAVERAKADGTWDPPA